MTTEPWVRAALQTNLPNIEQLENELGGIEP